MQDLAEEVDIPALHGLRIEEVVLLEEDASGEIAVGQRLYVLLSFLDDMGQVLDNEAQFGIRLCEGDGSVALRAAHLVYVVF